ncbi:MAG: sulfatase-like hydrolase/transferase [Planctomycetota bacterium]
MSVRFPALLLLLLSALPCPVGPAAEPLPGASRRPNILFILVDDQSPEDLPMYNPATPLQAPALTRLAQRGMVLDNVCHMGSFSGAVCTPSRHMMMSGRTLWHLPIGPHKGSLCPPGLEQNTVAAVFNRAGYATMRTCKVGNSYEGANRQFTVRRDATKRGGTAESGSAWHAEQVLDYLGERRRTNDQRPFYIHFGFSHPHDTRDGTPELLAKYGAVNHADPDRRPPLNPLQPALPGNYLIRHPFNNSDADVRDEVAVSGVWRNRDEASIRNELGREMACSESIDQQIGRVLQRLDELDELDNTVVIYTADHGMSIGRHGLMGKQNLYQHTWRVPFIVAGPGIPANSRAAGNAYLLDLLATCCDFAGITPPESNEGLSLRPVLEGHRKVVRDVLYGAYSGGQKPGIRCVRQGNWKLITYKAPALGIDEVQLFNLEWNPQELLPEHRSSGHGQTNLAGQPQHSGKLHELRKLLSDQMRLLDDPAATAP